MLFVLFRTTLLLFSFFDFAPVARFFEDFVFLQHAVTAMLEMTNSGILISVDTCLFGNLKTFGLLRYCSVCLCF